MSYIARTGNLAATPDLRSGDRGSYCYARVLVTDSFRTDDGYVDGPTVAYELSVSGKDAENLVTTAQNSGNVRVMFGGELRVTEWKAKDGSTRLENRVRVDEIGISLRGQVCTVSKPNAQTYAE